MTIQEAATRPAPLATPDDIRHAAAALHGVALRTPLVRSTVLEAAAHTPVFLKAESLQHTGSFKFRGAYWFVSGLPPADRARGLVAPSSGNHGQAVAAVASLFGVPVTVVLPTTVAKVKRDRVEALGARVVLDGTTSLERQRRAEQIRDRDGAVLVPPFDHRRIVEGQATVGLEILEDLDAQFGVSGTFTVLVPAGGGGLAAGVAAAVKQAAPGARVVAVEPQCTPKLSRALAAGEPVTVPAHAEGLADGLLGVRVGSVPFEHHKAFLDDVVSIGDGSLGRAVTLLLDRHRLLVEPSGAIAVAALLEGAVGATGPIVCVLSGGNVSLDQLRRLLEAA